MFIQNVTSLANQFLFSSHFISLNEYFSDHQTSFSFNVQIRPLNRSFSYLFFYQLNPKESSKRFLNEIDGWNLFCSSSIYSN